MAGQLVVALIVLGLLGVALMLTVTLGWAAFDATWTRASAFGAGLLVAVLVVAAGGLAWSTDAIGGSFDCGTFLLPVEYPRNPIADQECESARQGVLTWTLVVAVVLGIVAYSTRDAQLRAEAERETKEFNLDGPAELCLLTKREGDGTKLVAMNTDIGKRNLSGHLGRGWRIVEQWQTRSGAEAERVRQAIVRWWNAQPGTRVEDPYNPRRNSHGFAEAAANVDLDATVEKVQKELNLPGR